MNRIKIKWDEILSLKGLIQAFYDCKKGKKQRADIKDFENNLGYEISKLYKELKNGGYKPSLYCAFIIKEPKERMIFQPRLKDLIVQRLIYNAIYSKLDKKLFYHTYGVRFSRGCHAASRLAQRYMKENESFCQYDIKKYFASMKADILKAELSGIFKDKKLVYMMMLFAKNGVAIGNLLSGIFGLVYLRRLDSAMSAKRYIRFMDDFVVFGSDENKKIKRIVSSLGLEFSKIKTGKNYLNFVGFRITPHYRLLRKRAIKNYKKAIKKGNNISAISILGMAKGTQTIKYLKGVKNEILQIQNKGA